MRHLWLPVCLCFALPGLSQETSSTARFLQSLQTAEGGFQNAAGHGRASLMATAASLRALALSAAEPRDKSAAVRFLRSCMDDPSGGFCDRPGSKATVISTATGLMTLAELHRAGAVSPATSGASVDGAARFLEKNARTLEEIRMALAGLEAINSPPVTANAWLGQVLRKQRPDGTFGSLRDTASAVVIIMRLKAEVPNTRAVKRVLIGGQSADGGYSHADGQPSNLETTYVVTRALHLLRCEPGSVARCRNFVSRCRNGDGGYGMTPREPSQAAATYFALSILHWLEVP